MNSFASFFQGTLKQPNAAIGLNQQCFASFVLDAFANQRRLAVAFFLRVLRVALTGTDQGSNTVTDSFNATILAAGLDVAAFS